MSDSPARSADAEQSEPLGGVPLAITPRAAKRLYGFTLIEMAVVLVIAGLLVGTFLTMQRSLSQSQAANVTQARMEAIRKALVQHANLNGDLPCPAQRGLPLTSANFGREWLPPGAPSTELGGHCNSNVAAGAFPVTVVNPHYS